MKVLLFLLIPFIGFASFSDHHTGLTFDIPEGYYFNEDESWQDDVGEEWCYTFEDCEGNQLTVEVELYDHMLTLFDFFHSSMLNGRFDESISEENFVPGRFKFKQLEMNGRTFAKWELRALATENKVVEPVYICDYLFVQDQYGFSFSLLKRVDPDLHQKELDMFMNTLVESIGFNP